MSHSSPSSHAKALHNFFGTNLSFASQFVLRSPYRGYAVGALGLDAARKIGVAASAYQSLMTRTRLISVWSPFSGFSHGMQPPVFKPAVHHLVLTFVVGRPALQIPAERLRSRQLNNEVTAVYDTNTGMLAYLCVGFSSVEVTTYKISSMQATGVRYLYYSLGLILRAILGYHNPELSAADFEDSHSTMVYTGKEPLNLALARPYVNWALSPTIWRLCPNMLCPAVINQYTALRFLEVRSSITIDYQDAASDLVWDATAEQSVVTEIKRSLLGLLQSIGTKASLPTYPEPRDYLAGALIYHLADKYTAGMPVHPISSWRSVVSAAIDNKVDLSFLSSNPAQAAYQLLAGYPQFADKVADLLHF